MTYEVLQGKATLVSGLPTTAAAVQALAAARASAPRASLFVRRSDGAFMVHDGDVLVSEAEWRASFMAGRFGGAPQYAAQPIVGPMPPRRCAPPAVPAPCVVRFDERRASSPPRLGAPGAPWRDAHRFDPAATRRFG